MSQFSVYYFFTSKSDIFKAKNTSQIYDLQNLFGKKNSIFQQKKSTFAKQLRFLTKFLIFDKSFYFGQTILFQRKKSILNNKFYFRQKIDVSQKN